MGQVAQKSITVEIHQPPPSKLEHMEIFLGIIVALVTIGGFVWKMRGKNERVESSTQQEPRS